MKLEEIGFYTLSDERALNVTPESSLQRCELILTDRCNFRCPYCRGMKKEDQGDLSFADAIKVVDLWAKDGIKNVRFSGGEPTIWPRLVELVKYTAAFKCVEHIALSTNGSAEIEFYQELLDAGVNDFSISLDACCAKTAEAMSGGYKGFEHVVEVIKYLGQRTYVTVGVVLDDRNNSELESIIKYATGLGVSDIRIIPSAQSNHRLKADIETKFPILKYRLNNINSGRHVRGIQEHDCSKCFLVLDDMAVLNMKHYPCIIYMREHGEAIGAVSERMRQERFQWFKNHNSMQDPICKKNCLDVCIDHNNKVQEGVNELRGGIFSLLPSKIVEQVKQ